MAAQATVVVAQGAAVQAAGGKPGEEDLAARAVAAERAAQIARWEFLVSTMDVKSMALHVQAGKAHLEMTPDLRQRGTFPFLSVANLL